MQSTPSEPAAADSSIIRTGSDGRLRYSPAQRAELLEAFGRSGLSAMGFSRQHGVHYQTFVVSGVRSAVRRYLLRRIHRCHSLQIYDTYEVRLPSAPASRCGL